MAQIAFVRSGAGDAEAAMSAWPIYWRISIAAPPHYRGCRIILDAMITSAAPITFAR